MFNSRYTELIRNGCPPSALYAASTLQKGGSTTVVAPGPSPAEEALRNEQVELLRQQRDILSQQLREQNLLAPILFGRAGIKPIRDGNGEIVGYEEDPTSGDPEAREIEQLLQERTLKSLKGELPVDPGLMRNLSENEATLKETLRKNLGTGWETSTPGIQAMAEFTKRNTELQDAARRGDLTLAEQLGLARTSSNMSTTAQNTNIAGAIPGLRFGDIFKGTGAVAAGYNSPIQAFFQDRNLQANIANQNAQRNADGDNALGQLAGTAITAGAIYF